MPAVFYKRLWETVGERVKKDALEVLNGGEIPAGWNDTTMVLIPKVKKNPGKIKGVIATKIDRW